MRYCDFIFFFLRTTLRNTTSPLYMCFSDEIYTFTETAVNNINPRELWRFSFVDWLSNTYKVGECGILSIYSGGGWFVCIPIRDWNNLTLAESLSPAGTLSAKRAAGIRVSLAAPQEIPKTVTTYFFLWNSFFCLFFYSFSKLLLTCSYCNYFIKYLKLIKYT